MYRCNTATLTKPTPFMLFNFRTTAYLKETQAVLVESNYVVTDIDFQNLKAHVNKIDTYKKRNGKLCKVEHHFGRWVAFPKELVSYGKRIVNGTSNDWSVGDRVDYSFETTMKYLSKDAKQEIIKLYRETK